jgi:hypothetical protein
MKSKLIISILAVVVIGVAGFKIASATPSSNSSSEDAVAIIVHKSPYCGCCGAYSSYMDGLGYEVETQDTQDMASIKDRFGIPYELESCHTTEVAGYVTEGHIPEVAIQKLLTEQPDIKGIGMPGMPSGAPGMPGPKNGEFVIYEITNDGQKGDVFMRI